MPEKNPNPEGAKRSGGLDTLIKAERLTQIAFVLPSAVVVGWLGGALADHLLHQKWIMIVGIILGSISGLVFVVQTAVAAEKNSRKEDTTENGTVKGTSDDPS